MTGGRSALCGGCYGRILACMHTAFALVTEGLLACAIVMLLLGYELAAGGLTVLALATASKR